MMFDQIQGPCVDCGRLTCNWSHYRSAFVCSACEQEEIGESVLDEEHDPDLWGEA